MYSFLLGIYLGEELIDNKILMFSALVDVAKEFFKVVVPIYTSSR